MFNATQHEELMAYDAMHVFLFVSTIIAGVFIAVKLYLHAALKCAAPIPYT